MTCQAERAEVALQETCTLRALSYGAPQYLYVSVSALLEKLFGRTNK